MRIHLGLVAFFVLTAVPGTVLGQMAGLPVAQNAFVNPGVTVAANFGTEDRGTTYGGAVAWASGQRFGLALGGGYFSPDVADAGGAFTWGTRAVMTLPLARSDGPLGYAAFGGVGGTSVGGATELSVPIGFSVGYRATLSERRGVSIYAAPFYRWTRVSAEGETLSRGLFRTTLGFDAAIFPTLGISIGYELGVDAGELEPGPTGALVGIGISYALRR